MESLFYNLSEEEFSKSKKAMLWVFASFFFIAGLATIGMSIFFDSSINPGVSAAPFGISLVTGFIAWIATFSKSDHFFRIDGEKIEYKYGLFNVKTNSYNWNDIKDIYFPHKQKKVKLVLKNNSEVIINLAFIQKKKSAHIRKHLFYCAKELNLNIVKVQTI
jgi:hypothetical protein